MAQSPTQTDPLEAYRLPSLPPYAKLFVAIFTALVLCVCVGAAWLFVDQKIQSNGNGLSTCGAANDTSAVKMNQLPVEVRQELGEIAADSQAVTSPVWDTEHAGREKKIDSADIVRMARQAIAESRDNESGNGERGFSHYLRLAHAHFNGQTLLFFALGLVFLFSTVAPRTKMILYGVFGVSIICQAVGIAGQGCCCFFTYVAAAGGAVILTVVIIMGIIIFRDFARRTTE